LHRLEDNIYTIGENVIDYLVTKYDDWESGNGKAK
jgi:hypothetical protein